MIKHYFKITLRYFTKNKFISLIKIIGLTLGLFFFILGYLYVQDELKYDNHFQDADHIYRITGNNSNADVYIGAQPARFLPEIIKNIPEIENGSRVADGISYTIKINNNIFIENECIMADSNFFSFFQWPVISGSGDLEAKYKCLISESTAKKYFGNTSPIGKKLGIDNEYEVEVIGVFKDFPEQSHIRANIIISVNTFRETYPTFFNAWGCFHPRIYVKINKNSNVNQINEKLADLWTNLTSWGDEETNFKLQRFENIYLYSGHLEGEDHIGDLTVLKGVAIVSFIILLIGLINYILLTTSQLPNRTFEVGIRKSMGARSSAIMRQFLVESIVLVFISLIVTFNLAVIVIPKINSFLNKELSLNLSGNITFYVSFLVLVCIILILINLNPRIYFSKVNPVQIIRLKKANLKMANSIGEKVQIWIKNSLIVFQFGLTAFLIIGLLVINKQLKLILNKDYGFSINQILVINNPYNDEMHQRYNIFKEEMLKYPEIELITGATHVPTDGIWNWGTLSLAENSDISATEVGIISADFDYFKCLKSEIIEGRDFDQLKSDTLSAIINESCANALGRENLIGKRLISRYYQLDREIIGIVKDIDFYTGQRPIKNLIFMNRHIWFTHDRQIMVKFNTENIHASMDIIRNEWKNVAPEWTLDYFFLDENFEKNYRDEFRTRTIINVLTLVAIILSCLGLIGLSLHELHNRIKEIGIRKTNGARSQEIVTMLLKLFGKWAVIAFIIACPFGYYVMNRWLQNFSDSINLNWWIFVLSGLITLLIALITVICQSWKAANRNPIEALKCE